MRSKRDVSRNNNTIPIVWRTTVIDPGDGSGDGIIELPSELLNQLG